jgi:two-component system chemotaxis response regulator CheY
VANILIIEDDIPLQEAYSFILKTEGHHVTSAFNGKEGYDLAAKTIYELILLDLHMPVMNGWEFLEKYSPEKSDDTKIIVFSNMVEPDLQKQAETLGAYRSILKSSMTPSSMLTLVKETVGH